MKVRITKQQQPNLIPSCPVKLLTIPKDESTESITGTDESSKISQYILSNSSLATWGYPLPMVRDNINDTLPEAKRRKVESKSLPSDQLSIPCHESQTFAGLRIGYLESLEVSREKLSLGMNKVKVPGSNEVSVKSTISALSSTTSEATLEVITSEETSQCVNSEYFQTVEFPVALYGSYCPTSNTSTTCPCEYCTCNPEMIGIDCEMCDTENGLELTRVSIIDFHGTVILDSFVKPLSPILNYRQEYSGITPQILDPVTVTLEHIQLACLKIISSKTILVGHSLENDLRALGICHLRCIDTSVIYPHPKGYPLRNKLKYLAKEFLGKQIQAGTENGGHSSIEDARTAMELVKLKILNGPKFGLKGKNSILELRDPLLSYLPLDIISTFLWTDSDTLNAMRCCVSPRSDGILCSRNTETLDKAMKKFINIQRNHNPTSSLSSFLFISLTSTDQQTASLDQFIHLLETNLHEQRNALILVIHENNREKLTELQRRKIACMKISSVSIWNEELEEELQGEILKSNLVDIEIGVINKRTQI